MSVERVTGKSVRMRMRLGCAVAVLAFALPLTARALENAPTEEKLPIELTEDVKGQPLSLLAKFPKAGPGLARYVADALLKKPDAMDAILSIIPDTSPEQASAIGAGLVRALRGLLGKSPELVSQMNEKIIRSENVALKTTYFALGPHKLAYSSAGAGAALPPAQAAAAYGGSGGKKETKQIGEALMPVDSRLDVPKAPYVYPKKLSGEAVENIRERMDIHTIGMIVALVSSDAEHDGTVSTSPTH